MSYVSFILKLIYIYIIIRHKYIWEIISELICLKILWDQSMNLESGEIVILVGLSLTPSLTYMTYIMNTLQKESL